MTMKITETFLVNEVKRLNLNRMETKRRAISMQLKMSHSAENDPPRIAKNVLIKDIVKVTLVIILKYRLLDFRVFVKIVPISVVTTDKSNDTSSPGNLKIYSPK